MMMVKRPSERTFSVAGTVLGTLCALTQIFTTMQGRKYPHFTYEETEVQRGPDMAKLIQWISSMSIQSISVWLHSLHPSLCIRLIFKKKKKAAEGSVLALKEITVKDRMWSGSWARQRSGKGRHGRAVRVRGICRGAPWVRLSCFPGQHSVCWRSESQLGD